MSVSPFVIDPHNFDKYEETKHACAYVKKFLDLNNCPMPAIIFERNDHLKPPGKNPWHDNGWYWKGLIFVNIKASRVATKTPGFAWSYTGFKADMTAPGILAHEVGHYVHFAIKSSIDKKHNRVMSKCLAKLRQEEPNVSSYEPNEYELMAEAMRLFILNPNLLEQGRLARYSFLIGLGLKPLHNAPWRDVLKNAHPRIIAAAESWIKKGDKTRDAVRKEQWWYDEQNRSMTHEYKDIYGERNAL